MANGCCDPGAMICLRGQRMDRPAIIDGNAFELVLSRRVFTHQGQASMLRVPVTGVVPMR